MAEKPRSGSLFGIPYNFEPPKLRRMLRSYWQPGKGMLVEKPFGVGYTLNLANWRSWIALGVVGGLVWNERGADREMEDESEEEPVEVVVDD